MFGPESRIESKLLHFQSQVSKLAICFISKQFSWQLLMSVSRVHGPFTYFKAGKRNILVLRELDGNIFISSQSYVHMLLHQEDSAWLLHSLSGSLKSSAHFNLQFLHQFNNPIPPHDSDYYLYTSCFDITKRLYNSNPRIHAPLSQIFSYHTP